MNLGHTPPPTIGARRTVSQAAASFAPKRAPQHENPGSPEHAATGRHPLARAPHVSLLRLSAAARLSGALIVIAFLWALVFWALS